MRASNALLYNRNSSVKTWPWTAPSGHHWPCPSPGHLPAVACLHVRESWSETKSRLSTSCDVPLPTGVSLISIITQYHDSAFCDGGNVKRLDRFT